MACTHIHTENITHAYTQDIYTHTHIHTHTFIHTYMHTPTHVYTHTYTHTCTHNHTHNHTHTERAIWRDKERDAKYLFTFSFSFTCLWSTFQSSTTEVLPICTSSENISPGTAEWSMAGPDRSTPEFGE
jgi:hypothetical protein